MKYCIKKTVALLITLLVAAFFTFLFFEVIPANAALTKLGMDATEEEVEALSEALGLNRPFLIRYLDFLKNALTGDFGDSIQYRVPVLSLLSGRLLVTFGLALVSFVLILVFSSLLALFTAKGKNKAKSGFSAFLSQLMMAIPPFFLGMLISLFFGVTLHFFTPGGYVPLRDGFFPWISYLIFPAMAVAIPKIGMTVRFMQNEINRELGSQYVRTARGKGLSKGKVLTRHVMKNVLVPVITFLAMVLAEILAGSIVIEQVFNLQGVGRLLTVSIANRDFPVVRAIVLYSTAVVVFLNFLADILCRLLDPRIKEV